MNRDYFLLWQGQVVSQIGNQVYVIALMFWAMSTTESASLMGLLMSLFSLPAVLLGPVGGTVADRHSRKRIIVASDVANGLLVSAVGAALLLWEDARELHVVMLGVGAFASGVTQAFFRPAMTASIADLVPRERLATAISLFQGAMVLALIAGQAIGGVLYGLLGAALLFLANGLTFLLSAASETFMRLPPVPLRAEVAGGPAGGAGAARALRAYLRDTATGARYVWSRRGLRRVMLAFGVASFFSGPVVVLFPFYVRNSLGRGAEWYGLLMAAAGAGAVAGFALAARVRLAGRAASVLVTFALFAACALLALAGQLSVPLHALGVVFALGTSLAFAQILVRTVVQATTPSEIRGRTLALISLLSGGLAPLGMAFGGVLGDLTGKNVPLVYALSGGVAALAILLAALRREFWEFLGSLPGEPVAATGPGDRESVGKENGSRVANRHTSVVEGAAERD